MRENLEVEWEESEKERGERRERFRRKQERRKQERRRKSDRERKRVIKARSNLFLKFNGFVIDSVLLCGRVKNKTMKNQIITKEIKSAVLHDKYRGYHISRCDSQIHHLSINMF